MKAVVPTVPPLPVAGRPANARGGHVAWMGYQVAAFLLQRVSSSAAEPIVRMAAHLATGRRYRSAWARAVSDNLQAVHGGALEPAALRSLVRSVLETRLRSQVEMLCTDRRPDRLRAFVSFTPAAECWLRAHRRSGRGIMMVGPHTGNFDLMGRLLAREIPGLMALVAPDERQGYAVENRIRRLHGIDIQAISAGALRRAARHLAAGGAVVTGMDWPLPGSAPTVRFFGRKAPLAISPVRLAARAGVPLAVVSNLRDPAGRYRIDIEGPIDVKIVGHDRAALVAEAEALLLRLERIIRSAPGQWTMFHRVWPAAESMPPGEHP